MTYSSIIVYYGVVSLLPLFLWFDSRNIIFLLGIPFFIIAYLFGGYYFIDLAISKYGISLSTLEFYRNVLLSSAIVTSLSMFLGFHSGKNLVADIFKILISKVKPKSTKILNSKHIIFLSFLSAILFFTCFYGMKFIPLFAESPLEAKFFSGPYQDLYRPYAIPYRLAIIFAQVCMFFLIFRIFELRRRLDILMFITLFIFLILTLRRFYIGTALLSFLMCYISFYKKKLMLITVFLYIFVTAFGSASINLLLLISGRVDSLSFDSIIEGSPDIADHLVFLDRWLGNNWDFTYGKSLIGGLVPYQYDFNPAILSKLVVSNSKDVATGGFRLPVPILGYIAFGWYGIIFCSVAHGFLIGSTLRVYKFFMTSPTTFGELVVTYYSLDALFALVNSTFFLNIDTLLTFILTMLFFVLHRYRFIYSN
jgi:hypothetical protein